MVKPTIDGDGIGKPAHLFGFNETDNEWKAALINDDGALVTSGVAAVGLTTGLARASSSPALTDTYQDIGGATVTLATAGVYLIFAVFDFEEVNIAGTGDALGRLVVGGAAQGGEAAFGMEEYGKTKRGTVSQMWRVTGVSAGTIAKLQAKGPTKSRCRATNTLIAYILTGE